MLFKRAQRPPSTGEVVQAQTGTAPVVGGSEHALVGSAETALRFKTCRLLGLLESWMYAVLGGMLALTAALAILSVIPVLWREWAAHSLAQGILTALDRLLLSLMVIEILHTVRISVRSLVLSAEPFLIVGLIAAIRRILVLTLQTAYVGGAAGTEAPQLDALRMNLWEIGLLTALVFVLVLSLNRLAGPRPAGPGAEENP